MQGEGRNCRILMNLQYQWVDGQFSSDRDGGYMQQNTPSKYPLSASCKLS